MGDVAFFQDGHLYESGEAFCVNGPFEGYVINVPVIDEEPSFVVLSSEWADATMIYVPIYLKRQYDGRYLYALHSTSRQAGHAFMIFCDRCSKQLAGNVTHHACYAVDNGV